MGCKYECTYECVKISPESGEIVEKMEKITLLDNPCEKIPPPSVQGMSCKLIRSRQIPASGKEIAVGATIGAAAGAIGGAKAGALIGAIGGPIGAGIGAAAGAGIGALIGWWLSSCP